jgi:hypothetical protein
VLVTIRVQSACTWNMYTMHFVNLFVCNLIYIYFKHKEPFASYWRKTVCTETHHPDDWGSKHLWNVSLLQRDYMDLSPRRLSSSYSPLWEPEISQIWSDLYGVCNRCHYEAPRRYHIICGVMSDFFLFSSPRCSKNEERLMWLSTSVFRGVLRN